MIEEGQKCSGVVLQKWCNKVIVGPRKYLGDVVNQGASRLAFDLVTPMKDDNLQRLGTIFQPRAG